MKIPQQDVQIVASPSQMSPAMKYHPTKNFNKKLTA